MPRKPRTSNTWRSDPPDVYGRLQHWACFYCRKTFKSPLSAERLCPQCRQPMTNMGTDFKAPRQDDQEQWQKVRALAEAGVLFFPFNGDELPGERPATLAEVPDFLRRIRPPTQGQWLLERDRSQPGSPPREGRLEQHGSFPVQTFSLLGKPLESGTELEMFGAGTWRPVQFISQGNGGVPIPQPYVLPRTASMVFWNGTRTFVTPHHRLRWPQT